MKKLSYILASLFLTVSVAQAELAITVHKLNSMDVGDSIGVIMVKETADGVMFKPYLNGLTPSSRLSFSVNKNVACQGKSNKDGSGLADSRTIRSLPAINVSKYGVASHPVLVSDLKLNDIKGRTIVISQAKAGSIPSRVACGSLER